MKPAVSWLERQQGVERDGEIDALIEASLAELRRGYVGLGGVGTHRHAVVELATHLQRHPPIAGKGIALPSLWP